MPMDFRWRLDCCGKTRLLDSDENTASRSFEYFESLGHNPTLWDLDAAPRARSCNVDTQPDGHPNPLEWRSRCSDCGHLSHGPVCFNAASDNRCDCTTDEKAAFISADVSDNRYVRNEEWRDQIARPV